jgi:hypothetical protein
MKNSFSLMIIWICALFLCLFSHSEAQALSTEELLQHWSPLIYQQTDLRHSQADFLAAFDFDGDFDGFNNWEHLDSFPLKGTVYYHVSETDTLWYLYLGLFHPRDWEPGFDNPFSSHENDLEDIILVIHKDGSAYGRLLLLETQAHFDFHAYAATGLKARHTQIEGPLPLAGHHPRITVPPGGHGNYALYKPHPPLPGILYQWGQKPQEPPEPSLTYPLASYLFLPFEALWQRRYEMGPGRPFRRFGEFGANDYTWLNPASAPWLHDDINDGPVWPGDLFSDPDYALRQHVVGLPAGRVGYLQEPLYTHRLELGRIRILKPVKQPSLSLWQGPEKVWETALVSTSDGDWKVSPALRYFSLPYSELELQIEDGARVLARLSLQEPFSDAGDQAQWQGLGVVWVQAVLKRAA